MILYRLIYSQLIVRLNGFVVVVQVLWVNEEGLQRASEATKQKGHPVR